MNSLQEHPAPRGRPSGESYAAIPSAGSCGSALDSQAYRVSAPDQAEQGYKRYQAARVLHGDSENVSILRGRALLR